MRRRLIAGGGAAFAAIASGSVLAMPAQAATTGAQASAAVIDPGIVEFIAAAGTTNRLTITNVGDTVTFDDRVAIRAGEGCESVPGDRTSVRCTTPRATSCMQVSLGDRDDTLTNKATINVYAHGGLRHLR